MSSKRLEIEDGTWWSKQVGTSAARTILIIVNRKINDPERLFARPYDLTRIERRGRKSWNVSITRKKHGLGCSSWYHVAVSFVSVTLLPNCLFFPLLCRLVPLYFASSPWHIDSHTFTFLWTFCSVTTYIHCDDIIF